MKSFNGKWQLVGLVALGSEYDDMNLIQTGKTFNSPFQGWKWQDLVSSIAVVMEVRQTVLSYKCTSKERML